MESPGENSKPPLAPWKKSELPTFRVEWIGGQEMKKKGAGQGSLKAKSLSKMDLSC